MKTEELKEILNQAYNELRKELTTPQKKSSITKNIKKIIARVKTILKERGES
jgi:ribosomal protein L29